MQRVIIDIPENKINFFMELIAQLGFKKVKRVPKGKKEFADDIKESLKEVEKHRQGKIKLSTAKEFLDEL